MCEVVPLPEVSTPAHDGSAPLTANSSLRPRISTTDQPRSRSPDPPTADTRHHLRDSIILGVDVQPSGAWRATSPVAESSFLTSTETKIKPPPSRSRPEQDGHHEQVRLPRWWRWRWDSARSRCQRCYLKGPKRLFIENHLSTEMKKVFPCVCVCVCVCGWVCSKCNREVVGLWNVCAKTTWTAAFFLFFFFLPLWFPFSSFKPGSSARSRSFKSVTVENQMKTCGGHPSRSAAVNQRLTSVSVALPDKRARLGGSLHQKSCSKLRWGHFPEPCGRIQETHYWLMALADLWLAFLSCPDAVPHTCICWYADLDPESKCGPLTVWEEQNSLRSPV